MRLVLTTRAEADLDAIAAYLFARNPQAARRVDAELRAAFRRIETFPYAGHELRRGVRRFTLPRYPYLIFYGVDEAETIRVFTVRHASRQDEH